MELLLQEMEQQERCENQEECHNSPEPGACRTWVRKTAQRYSPAHIKRIVEFIVGSGRGIKGGWADYCTFYSEKIPYGTACGMVHKFKQGQYRNIVFDVSPTAPTRTSGCALPPTTEPPVVSCQVTGPIAHSSAQFSTLVDVPHDNTNNEEEELHIPQETHQEQCDDDVADPAPLQLWSTPLYNYSPVAPWCGEEDSFFDNNDWYNDPTSHIHNHQQSLFTPFQRLHSLNSLPIVHPSLVDIC